MLLLQLTILVEGLPRDRLIHTQGADTRLLHTLLLQLNCFI